MLHLHLVNTNPALPPRFDIALDGTGCALESAVIQSLFLDARAPIEAIEKNADRRGFWADVLDNKTTGSLLWLLRRQKITATVLRDAKDFSNTALAWLVQDNIAQQVTVKIERLSTYNVVLTVLIQKSDGSAWNRTWQQLFYHGQEI